jgi:hypothetical protein
MTIDDGDALMDDVRVRIPGGTETLNEIGVRGIAPPMTDGRSAGDEGWILRR